MNFWELLVIAIVALIVFGPKKLPELAHNLGRGLRVIRSVMDKANRVLEQPWYEEQLKKNIAKAEAAEKLKERMHGDGLP